MQLKLIRGAESKWAWSVLIGAMAGVTYFYNKRVEENRSALLPKLLAASEEEKKVKVSVFVMIVFVHPLRPAQVPL